MNNRGMLIVYSGPSGAGKGTLIRPLLERDPGLVMSISATTRSPRPGEREGVDYHFVGEGEFSAMQKAGELLEHAVYNGHRYGTPRRYVEEQLARGRNVVLEIEIQGARQVRHSCPRRICLCKWPPSMEELKNGWNCGEPKARPSGRPDGRPPPPRRESKNIDYIVRQRRPDRAVERLARRHRRPPAARPGGWADILTASWKPFEERTLGQYRMRRRYAG
jgi:guanylate kinase